MLNDLLYIKEYVLSVIYVIAWTILNYCLFFKITKSCE